MRRTTFSSRAYSSTGRCGASRLATALPKLPAPITPTDLRSDGFFEVITHQPVVIIVKKVEILCDDVAFFIEPQGAFEVKDPYVFHAVADHQVNIALEVGGM